MWSFRRPGGNAMEQASSDAAAILFFLKKRKKRMGAQNIFEIAGKVRQCR